MMRKLLIVTGLLSCMGLFSQCRYFERDQKTTGGDTANQMYREKEKTPGSVPEKKKADLNKPVAVFSANKADEVTNNDFIVRVFPTEDPQEFKVEIQFGNNKAQDKVNFPPPKYMKKVVLKKGSRENTCILGFMGNEGKFNEMKEIVCTTTTIKINALKAYYFTTK